MNTRNTTVNGAPRSPRPSLLLAFASTAAIVAALSCGTAQAGTDIARLAKGATTPVQGEVQSLQQAYSLLAAADHDYKGHRAKAMHSVKAACKELGSHEGADGKGHEAQGTSDAQLRQAQGILQQARNAAAGANQPRVLKHLDEALKQLSIALSIK